MEWLMVLVILSKKYYYINVESHLEFVWVQFDQADVGVKTCHDNKHLNTQGIKQEWTLIKPITTQFAVGRNRIAQVVRKQLALQTESPL